MSHTREALMTLTAAVEVLARGPSLPSDPPSARLVRTLSAQDVAPAKPPGDILEKLRQKLQLSVRENRGYAYILNREMRLAPWLLWTNTNPLATLPGLLDELAKRAEARHSFLRALLEAWISGYALDAPNIREAAAILRRLVAASTHPSINYWREADRVWNIFDVPEGPRVLAAQVVKGSERVSDILTKAGFHDPLRAVSGYMRATQEQVLSQTPAAITGRAGVKEIQRIFEFLASDSKLRFDEPVATGQVANTLLRPWVTGTPIGNEKVRKMVQDFLVSRLGEPRLRPQRWSLADHDVVKLMVRWLAKVSLDIFVSVIADHAEQNHWHFRSAFWLACSRNEAIDDAWIILGPQAHATARTLSELRGAYGRLTGGAANHSVLLLRIGRLIFCEWSHSGALRTWRADDAATPQLGKASYHRAELMLKSEEFPVNDKGRGGAVGGAGLSHLGSDVAYWQESAARLIAQNTSPSVYLKRKDYMPR